MTSVFAVARHTSGASAPRQHASWLAARLGFDDTRAAQAALIVSELATNIARHADEGEILISEVATSGEPGVEILAIDKGPGVPPRALADGYSTAGSLGSGLGAVQRLADDFEIFTQPGIGTVVLARLRAADDNRRARVPLRTAINVAKPGESVCGDAWDVRETPAGRQFIVADGLGHGPQAADAAREAIRVFATRPALAPSDLVDEIHRALRSTRGAAVAVALLDLEQQVLRFTGVGNIAATLVGEDLRRRNIASLNGTAGHAMRRIQEFTYPLTPPDVLVMHSDGLATHWSPADYPGLWDRDPALTAGVLYRDFNRGRDDVTVLVARTA